MSGEPNGRTLLRFMTCGSVDDGKSTLIGRLLYDSGHVLEDQLAAVAIDSRRWGANGLDLDLALLLDGLTAEREQGITIDVAYLYFSTPQRKFIVADAPGHEQYTRNMVTAASTVDLAVLLVDARRGIVDQTRRHCYLAWLLGIRNVILAVNKLDLIDYDQLVFRTIEAEFASFAECVGFEVVTCLPISALRGDNLIVTSANTPWYEGPSLLGLLETVDVKVPTDEGASRLPVQWVNRPNQDFRGFSGTVVRGFMHPGDRVRVLPSGRETTIERIVTFDGDLDVASVDQAVTLVLSEDVDACRGDVIANSTAPTGVANQFETSIIWMGDHELLPGRPYLAKLGARTVGATVDEIKYKVNVATLERVATKTLKLNEIGVCNVHLDRPVPFDPYEENRAMGGFIVIDRVTNATVGACMVHFALRRSHNLQLQPVEVRKTSRADLKHQLPCVIWLTGLSGAGKSTIANGVERELHSLGLHTYLLDGDNIRQGLNKDLGFTEPDRVENIRRVAEVAALMVDAGLIVLAAFISPFRAERQLARDLVGEGEFCEVYVEVPLDVAETRDPKGLYAKARRGELMNFTGIDSEYEPPDRAEVSVNTAEVSPEEAILKVIDRLRAMGLLARAETWEQALPDAASLSVANSQ